MKWTIEEHNYLIQLKKKDLTWQQIAERMTAKFEKKFTRESCRSRWRHTRHALLDEPTYKETVEIKADGSQYSDKLIEMSHEQSKDAAYLLKAHGYDDSWEIVSAKSSIWNQHNKQDGTLTLYSSKITVRPRKDNEIDKQTITKIIDRLPTIKIPKNISEPIKESPYLNIPLFDMHFGISDYSYYTPTQQRILHFIEKPRKDILFIIGQDLFHNDDFRGRTSSGREIEKVNMEQAFEDAWLFYVPLIEKAIKRSEKIHVYYSNGNHDEFSGWSFVKALEKRYKDDIIFDSNFKERKVHMLGENFIGMNHSDKKKMKFLSENFATEFPQQWSKASTREVFTGHEHREEEWVQLTEDNKGIVLRRMPTRNKTDGWHYDMGYTTAHKRFKIFEYNETEVTGEYYV